MANHDVSPASRSLCVQHARRNPASETGDLDQASTGSPCRRVLRGWRHQLLLAEVQLFDEKGHAPAKLPESIGSATEMRATGRPSTTIGRLWIAVAVVCTLATVVGYGIADAVGNHVKAAINGFAAGALLVMLVDSMIPEAREKSGRAAGLMTVLGFAVAAGLSAVSA
jgi:hypothetical protein